MAEFNSSAFFMENIMDWLQFLQIVCVPAFGLLRSLVCGCSLRSARCLLTHKKTLPVVKKQHFLGCFLSSGLLRSFGPLNAHKKNLPCGRSVYWRARRDSNSQPSDP